MEHMVAVTMKTYRQRIKTNNFRIKTNNLRESIRSIQCQEFNVEYSTLHDHVKGTQIKNQVYFSYTLFKDRDQVENFLHLIYIITMF